MLISIQFRTSCKASVSYLALNVFLLLIAFRILGYKFCLKTIYGVGK